jgi:hypothetical protein
VSSKECSEAAFIGRRGLATRRPEVGVRRRATGQGQARRLWEHAGVRGCALWCCHERVGVLDRADERQRDGGGPGCFSPILPGLTAGVWAGETGSRQRGARGCPRVLLRELGRTRDGVGYSASPFTDFCPPGVRPNARKKLNFEFLENSNWGCQDIKPGFQKYFC